MRELFSLAGKAALVTGAGRGIGQAIAVALAHQGADVALASRSESELMASATLAEATGQRAFPFPVDLGQSGAATTLVDQAAQALGRLDILVTSSGTIVRKPALDMGED